MRERPVIPVVDKEILGKRKVLPQRRYSGVLPPQRPEHIQRQHHKVDGQNSIRAVTIKPRQRNAPSIAHWLQQLRANQIAAENEEEVDAHPPKPRDGTETIREPPAQVKYHDQRNRQRTKRIEACKPVF